MPNFRDLKRYLEGNGWELWKNSHHMYYRKLEDGQYRYTYVSHSLGKEIPPNIWKKILKKDLGITQEEFNKNS